MSRPDNTAQRMERTFFTGWRLLEGDRHAHREDALPSSLAQIERHIATAGNFGATVLIVEHDAIAETEVLHVYRIRRGKWAGAYDRQAGTKVYPHTADKLFAMPVKAFEPAEAWRWTPGCDVVGRGARVIEIEAVRR